jgi:dynactin complex subunit
MKASPNADKAMAREKADLNEKMNQLKSDILQYENNLGFFAKSKGADALRKEVENKIATAHRKIEDIKNKIKLLAAN